MAFDFEKLKPEARRAAFAHMKSRKLGAGARHANLSSKKPVPPPATAAKSPSTGASTPSHDSVLAQRYRVMHGDAGVRRKIAQMQGKKRLSSAEKSQLDALKGLR